MGAFFFYFEIFNFTLTREYSSLSLHTKTSFSFARPFGAKSRHINIFNKRFYVKGTINNTPELEPLLKDILVGVILGDG
jgi:hypothetical protein